MKIERNWKSSDKNIEIYNDSNAGNKHVQQHLFQGDTFICSKLNNPQKNIQHISNRPNLEY